jgi:hypothetical protein
MGNTSRHQLKPRPGRLPLASPRWRRPRPPKVVRGWSRWTRGAMPPRFPVAAHLAFSGEATTRCCGRDAYRLARLSRRRRSGVRLRAVALLCYGVGHDGLGGPRSIGICDGRDLLCGSVLLAQGAIGMDISMLLMLRKGGPAGAWRDVDGRLYADGTPDPVPDRRGCVCGAHRRT